MELTGDPTPSFLDVPFPSDAYRQAGKIVVPLPGLDQVFNSDSPFLSHELATMDGFSAHACAAVLTTRVKDSAGHALGASAEIWVSFAIPTAPMPPSGYPVVIVGHGLPSQRLYMLELVKLQERSRSLAAAVRGGGPQDRSRKNAYSGDSWGSITGAVATAIEPHVKAWLLNVAGGALFTDIVAHGPTVAPNLAAAGTFNFRFGPKRFDESHPLNVIGEPIFDPGDPVTYAAFFDLHPHTLAGAPTAPRNIIRVEDELVANEGDEALARASGMGLAAPNVGSKAGIAGLKHLDQNPSRVLLRDVAPDATGIHDTPVQGATAVVVQAGPAQHGYDIVRRRAQHSFRIPFNTTDGSEPFHAIDVGGKYYVSCPYAISTTDRRTTSIPIRATRPSTDVPS